MRFKKKGEILLAVMILAALFSACGDGNTGVEATAEPAISQPTATVESPVPSGTPELTSEPTSVPGVPSSPEPDSPADDIPPPVILGELRPETGTLTAYFGGVETEIEAELVYQHLSESPFVAFSIYSDIESFSLKQERSAFTFTATDKDDSPFLEINFIAGTDSDTIKPYYADSYIYYKEMFLTSAIVGEDNIRCTSVTAFNDERFVEAYLIDVYGGVVTAVLSCPADSQESDTDAAKLYAMLDTLVIHEL